MSNAYENLRDRPHEETKKPGARNGNAVAHVKKEKNVIAGNVEVEDKVNELLNIFPNVARENLKAFVMEYPTEAELSKAVQETIEGDVNLNKVVNQYAKIDSRGKKRKQA